MPDFGGLYRALQDKTVNSACVYCGANKWLSGSDHLVRLVAIPDPSAPITAVGFTTIPLFCGNCGFVRLHSTTALDPDGTMSGAAAQPAQGKERARDGEDAARESGDPG